MLICFTARNVARSRNNQFYFSQLLWQLATAVAQCNPAPATYSKAFPVWLTHCFIERPTDRRPRRREIPQVFSARIVASCSDRVARCNTSPWQLQQNALQRCVAALIRKVHRTKFKNLFPGTRTKSVRLAIALESSTGEYSSPHWACARIPGKSCS